MLEIFLLIFVSQNFYKDKLICNLKQYFLGYDIYKMFDAIYNVYLIRFF